jgi:hypothetical protein
MPNLTSTQQQAIIHFALLVLQVYVSQHHPELVPYTAALQAAFGVGMQDKKV